MVDSEKLVELKLILDPIDDDDSTLLSFLHLAKDIILNRMYPYLEDEEYEKFTVPKRYENKQIQIAAYLLNKRGVEGQLAHSENGISRTYKSAYVPDDLMWDVLPSIGIPR